MNIETAFDRKYSKMNEYKPEDIPSVLSNKTMSSIDNNEMVDSKSSLGIDGLGKIIFSITLWKVVFVMVKKKLV